LLCTSLMLLLYAVHSNKVTHTSGQNEAMENFVGAEVFVQPVKYREFAGINDSADRINDSAGKEPAKRIVVEQGHNITKGEYAQPAHGNVENGGHPFWTINKKDTL